MKVVLFWINADHIANSPAGLADEAILRTYFVQTGSQGR
jgi:hypothetical protein